MYFCCYFAATFGRHTSGLWPYVSLLYPSWTSWPLPISCRDLCLFVTHAPVFPISRSFSFNFYPSSSCTSSFAVLWDPQSPIGLFIISHFLVDLWHSKGLVNCGKLHDSHFLRLSFSSLFDQEGAKCSISSVGCGCCLNLVNEERRRIKFRQLIHETWGFNKGLSNVIWYGHMH